MGRDNNVFEDEHDKINETDMATGSDTTKESDTANELGASDELVNNNRKTDKKSDGFKLGKKRHFRRKRDKGSIIRIEELEEIMAQQGGDVDPEKVVSMYLPHRKRRQIGRALLRLDKLEIVLLVMMLLVAGLFIVAFMQEKMGNFTINLNRLELYRKGISIDESGDFENATAKLVADTVQDATNISINDLPEDIDQIEGSHNGKNYMAYTYYIRNAGKEDLGYIARVTMDSCAKGAENAVRVAIWKNGERVVYAAPAADGNPEEGCVNFKSDKVVCAYEENDFLVGNVDKYTIVIWMEGDDPECVDSIIGGSAEFSMHIAADYEDDTSLVSKFVKDIKDTLSDDKPINAAGNEAPNDGYYTDGEVRWDTRRNQ